jgi:hypothetical protein
MEESKMSEDRIDLPGGYHFKHVDDCYRLMAPGGASIAAVATEQAKAFAAAMQPGEALVSEIVEAVYANEDPHAAVAEILKRGSKS